MNKICTSIDQSKKLIELGIDVNTADMVYCIELYKEGWKYSNEAYPIDGTLEGDDIPAWSLAALLSVIPKSLIYTPSPFLKGYCCKNIENDIETYGDDSVDAAFEMIVWLKENGKI